DPLAVVVHFIMNELFQLRPVLLIQAGNVVSVDVAEVGFNHGIFPVLLHGPCCKVGQGEVPQPRIASPKSNRAPSRHSSPSRESASGSGALRDGSPRRRTEPLEHPSGAPRTALGECVL